MAFSIATAFVDIKPMIDSAGVKDAVNDMGSKFQNGLQGVADKATKAGKTLTAGLTAPILGIGALAFDQAAQLEDATGAVEAVYGDLAGGIMNVADTSAKALGMSKSAYLDNAAVLGGMTQAMGLSEEQASDMAQTTIGLSADLASFYGTDQDQAFNALKSALAGETEGMKAFGVVISQASVEQKALEMGLWDGKGAIDANAKAMATQALIMEQTTQVQGDYARTSDSATNTMKSMKAQFSDVAAQLGTQLLPMGTRLMEMVSGWLERFQAMSPEMQKWVVRIGLIAAAIGPLLLGVGAFASALIKLTQAFKIVKGAMIALKAVMMANPFTLLIAAVVALVVIIVMNWDKIKSYLAASWKWIQKTATSVWNSITAFFKKTLSAITKAFSSVWNGIKSFLSRLWNGIKSTASSVFNGIKSFLSNVLNGYKALFTAVWNAIKSVVTGVMNALRSAVTGAANSIRSAISNAFNAAKNLAISAFNNMKSRVTGTINSLLGLIRGLPGRIRSGLGNLGGLLRSAGMDLIRGLINGVRAMAGRVASAAKSVVKGAIDSAKRLLRLGSPSRLFHQFGEWTGEGLAIGLEDQQKNVRKSAQKMMDFGPMPSVETGVAMAGAGAGRGRHTGGGVSIGNLNINVDGKFDFNDPLEQRRFAERIREHIMRLEGEYA